MIVSIPKSRIVFLLSLMIVVLSFPAWAVAAPVNQAFSAKFEWKNPARNEIQILQIRVAAGFKRAQILAQGRVLADCQTKIEAPMTETGRAIASIAADQIDLECEASEFGALTGPATLIFKAPGVDNPVIRFGTWLNGYRQADLLVMNDGFARTVQRKPALVALQGR